MVLSIGLIGVGFALWRGFGWPGKNNQPPAIVNAPEGPYKIKGVEERPPFADITVYGILDNRPRDEAVTLAPEPEIPVAPPGRKSR